MKGTLQNKFEGVGLRMTLDTGIMPGDFNTGNPRRIAVRRGMLAMHEHKMVARLNDSRKPPRCRSLVGRRAEWRLLAVILCWGAIANHTVCGDEPPRVSPLFVTLIGGFDSEPTAEQLAETAPRGTGNSGMFQLCGDLKRLKVSAQYFNWNGSVAGKLHEQPAPQAAEIARSLRQHHELRPQDRLAIVGNSWGGHTAWEVAQALAEEPVVPLDLIVFLDPSSFGRLGKSKPESLPANVRRAVTFRTRNAFVWNAWPDDPRLEQLDLGDPKHGFLKKSGPAFDAAFDWKAHVAVEWDAGLHREVQNRLLKLTQPDEATPPQ